ncbi:MAG: peroxidase family protein, partial [Hyphomicrobiaceae bacterium]
SMIEPAVESSYGDSEVPAGYTFLAQFIDHDITFDTTSMLNRPLPDEDFSNARTADLDLDSVYAGGPEQDPYLYNLPYLRVGKSLFRCGPSPRFDLLRVSRSDRPGPQGGSARALIGDPRNDENFVIAQLHAAFIAYHNRFVDVLVSEWYRDRLGYDCRDHDAGCGHRAFAVKLSRKEKQRVFEAARDHVTHYYHRIILEDFLPRLIGELRVQDILRNGRDFFFPKGFHSRKKRHKSTFIPVEFAVAAFRYGHSQVREKYQLRYGVRTNLLNAARARGGGSPAFQPVRPDLLVDWRYFFPIDRSAPRGFNLARRIDREIAPFLHDLGRSRVVGRRDVISLPARNLSRSLTFRLPSGQAVASRILPVLYKRGVLSADWLKRTGAKYRRSGQWKSYVLHADKRTRGYLRADESPLWYYMLQEAEAFGGPSYFGADARAVARRLRRGHVRLASLSGRADYRYVRKHRGEGYRAPDSGSGYGGHTLGPVGGTIVGEVLTGLLEHYRKKSGKGLSYRPIIGPGMRIGSGKYGRKKPSSGAYRFRSGRRYLMANLIIDAGHAAPIVQGAYDDPACGEGRRHHLSSHGGIGTKSYHGPRAAPRRNARIVRTSRRRSRYRRNRHRTRLPWVKRVLRTH